MTAILIIILVLLLILGYLFFAPFYLEVNTATGLYRIRFHKLASARLFFTNESIMSEIKIGWFTKQIDLLEPRTIEPVERKNSHRKISWKKMKAVLASFKINKCTISVDTGDVELNGILYPVLYGLSVYTGKNIRINFLDENFVILEIKNSVARMSWAYLRA
jgi:hypothetical protein